MNSKRLLLDGATGTELNRRGIDTGLPLWSANALTTDAGLNVLRQVHLDYLNAGADIITTNTFRTNRRALAGKKLTAHELTLRAVATSREAVAEFGKPALVAGSLFVAAAAAGWLAIESGGTGPLPPAPSVSPGASFDPAPSTEPTAVPSADPTPSVTVSPEVSPSVIPSGSGEISPAT